MPVIISPRGKRKLKYRSMRYVRKNVLPRLALWAGVGVFIITMALSCGEEGPAGPAGNDEGVVYSVRWREEDTNLLLVKFDGATGARLGTYPIKDYKRDYLRATGVNRGNGDVYLAFINGFVRMGSEGQIYFDRYLGLHSIYNDNEVLVDAGAKRIWIYDHNQFYLHDADTGDELKTIKPIGKGAVSEYDHTLVAGGTEGGTTELVKLSKDGDEVWRRVISAETRICESVAVDPKDGTIFVVSTRGSYPYTMKAYFQRLTPDGEVVFVKEIAPPGLPLDEVSARDGTIWAAAGHLFHLNRDGEIIKELEDKRYYESALSRVSDTLFVAIYDGGYLIRAIDTKTYRVVWSVRLDNVSALAGWANSQ